MITKEDLLDMGYTDSDWFPRALEVVNLMRLNSEDVEHRPSIRLAIIFFANGDGEMPLSYEDVHPDQLDGEYDYERNDDGA